jgi:hypothetical protein
VIYRCYKIANGDMYPIDKIRALKAANKMISKAINTPGMTIKEQTSLIEAMDIITSLIPEVVR